MKVKSGKMFAIPYCNEINDIPLYIRKGYTGEQFLRSVVDQFDALYADSRKQPRVMGVPLHPMISGQPLLIKYRSAHERTSGRVVCHGKRDHRRLPERGVSRERNVSCGQRRRQKCTMAFIVVSEIVILFRLNTSRPEGTLMKRAKKRKVSSSSTSRKRSTSKRTRPNAATPKLAPPSTLRMQKLGIEKAALGAKSANRRKA